MYDFELFQREFLNPPQKECTILLSPLKQVFKKFWPPSPVDHPPTAEWKMTNPLDAIGNVRNGRMRGHLFHHTSLRLL